MATFFNKKMIMIGAVRSLAQAKKLAPSRAADTKPTRRNFYGANSQFLLPSEN